jgi:hypothetical protein
MTLGRMSPRRLVQSDRKQAHAGLRWAPNEIMVEVGFALMKKGGEGVASQNHGWPTGHLPGILRP